MSETRLSPACVELVHGPGETDLHQIFIHPRDMPWRRDPWRRRRAEERREATGVVV